MIVHVSNVYHDADDTERQRLKRAHKTWHNLYMAYQIRRVHVTDPPRTAQDVGDPRNCPFVKDIIQAAVDICADHDDLIVLTNSDACIVRDAIPLLENWGFEAAYSKRRNFRKPLYYWMNAAEIDLRGEKFEGVDLVAFTLGWWNDHKDQYPDMLMGYEAWDWIFKFMIGQKTPMDLVYHENHGTPGWLRGREIWKGQLHNRHLAKQWVDQRQDKDYIYSQWEGIRNYR